MQKEDKEDARARVPLMLGNPITSVKVLWHRKSEHLSAHICAEVAGVERQQCMLAAVNQVHQVQL